MGQVLQGGAGPGARAAGRDRCGDPDRGAGGHDQQGVRVVDPRGRDRRLDDPRRRRRARRDGRHGVDVERAVHPRAGPLRLPARRRDAHRPDDARRAHVVVRREAHGRAGVVRRHASSGIAREDQDRWALRSHERAAAAQDAGRFDDEIVRRRRAHRRRERAPRHDVRAARGAEAGVRPGRHDHRGERARRERRRLVRRRLLGGVREAARARAARHGALAGLRRGRVRVPRAYAREGRCDGARAGRQDDRRRAARRAERGVRVGRAQLDGSCSAPTRRSST